jgi:threonine aldolase
MKTAMFAAPLGDDVLGDDPTVLALEARIAAETGQQAALFTPSGTMANQIAIALHTRPGDEVLMADTAHPYHYEAGGAAMISGVQTRLLPTTNGQMSAEAVALGVRRPDVHHAPATLLCVEDTSNKGGGTVHDDALLAALVATAKANNLATHLDGARAYNAAVAAGELLASRVSRFDTVSICFSKGLGAPVGSALCGSTELITRGRRVRKMLGGGMRQAGLLAAAALHALDHHVVRLADDHKRARSLAMGLMVEGFTVRTPETNLVYVDVPGAQQAQDFLATHGILAFATSPSQMRLVTHLDVDDAGIERTLSAFRAWRSR